MVLLITTSSILSALEAIPSPHRHDLNLPDSPSLDTPISHEQLIALSHYLRSNNDASKKPPITLNSLLRGTKVYVPPPPKKPEPTPEYLALKARLLAAAEEEAYTRMTTPSFHNNTTQKPDPIFATPANDNNDDQSSEDTLTPSLVLNIFLSVLITGFSVYWALTTFSTPHILVQSVSPVWNAGGGRGASEALRVLVALFSALGVGVTEVAIYVIYLGKVERARRKEGKIRERKVVVGREVVGGSSSGGEVDVGGGDKEEIWGRGVNGGLRRRVRERWEEKDVGKVQGEDEVVQGDGDGDGHEHGQ